MRLGVFVATSAYTLGERADGWNRFGAKRWRSWPEGNFFAMESTAVHPNRTLLEFIAGGVTKQAFVKDPSKTVEQHLDGGKITTYVRIAVA